MQLLIMVLAMPFVCFQRAVGVLDDGAVGDKTLGAIKKMTLDDVLILFIAERLEFYTKLSTFNSFGRGWHVEWLAISVMLLEIHHE